MSFEVSIVIPCYNGATWLPETIHRINVAVERAGIERAEIVIVDDGSSDGSADVARQLDSAVAVKVIEQPNQGRFLARKNGVVAAQYDRILFIDTRVYLGENALKFLVDQSASHPDRVIWNGHVFVAKEGNIIARFMDAVTFIGWRRYFAHPKTTSYGLKDFDYYPKGTTCFLAPKSILLAAMEVFEAETNDLKHSSDDTLLIRLLAEHERINLSPQFDCTYHARTKLSQFIKHTYFRGQFFVDGFLRKGTRFYYPLLAFLALTLGLLTLVIVTPRVLAILVPVFIVVWILELIVARVLRVPIKDAASLTLLSPIFALMYGAGIWRAVIRKYVRI